MPEVQLSYSAIAEADHAALVLSPPLGVRGLAQRWVKWKAWASRADVDDEYAGDWNPHEGPDLDALLGWVHRRMLAYVRGCCAIDWAWSSTSESDRDEMAGWIGSDLELDGANDDEVKAVAMPLCELAVWP